MSLRGTITRPLLTRQKGIIGKRRFWRSCRWIFSLFPSWRFTFIFTLHRFFCSPCLRLRGLSLTLPLKTKRQRTASKGHNGLTQIERSFLVTCRMYWSVTSLYLDLIPTLGARSNYLAWRKHLSPVLCPVQRICQTVARYFFCLLHKSAFTFCHSVFLD